MKFWRRLGDVDPRRDASSCTPLAQNHSDFWRFRFLEAALNLRVVGSIPTRLTSLRLLALPLCASYGWQAKEGCSPRAPKLSGKAEAKAARLTSLRLLALPLCASYGWQAKEGCSPRAPKLSRKAEAKAARLTSIPIQRNQRLTTTTLGTHTRYRTQC